MKSRILFTVVFITFHFFSACSQSPSPQEFFSKAQSYHNQGNLKSAIISLKNALQAKPDYLEARVLLGEIYLATGDGESAEKEFLRALNLSSQLPQLQIDLVKALLLQEKYNDIVAREVDLSTLPPQQQVQWLRIRAESYIKLNSPIKAEQALNQAVALKLPSKELALAGIKLQFARHDVAAAKSNLEKLLAQSPDFAEAWYFSSVLERQQKEYEKAEQALQKVVQLTDAQLLSRLGFYANIELIDLQIGVKKFDNAKQNLQRLQSKTHSRHPLLKYFAAFLAYHDKSYNDAKNLLQEVVQASPDFMPSYLLLGATQYALQEYEGANVSVEKYISSVPQNFDARKLLAEIQLKQNRPIDALEVLSSVPKSEEKDERFLNMLARATLSSGDVGSAIQNIRELVKSNPSNVQLRTELVQALLQMGDFDEAIKEIEASGISSRQKVISKVATRMRQGKFNIARNILQAELAKDKDAPLLTLAGIVELSDKKNDAANTYFQQALEKDANYTPALIYLARASLKAREYEKAEEQLNQVLKLQPQNWLALLNMANVAAGLKKTPEQVLVWVERANEANPAALGPASILIRQALVKGEKEKSLRLAQSLVGASSNNPKALILLAKVQFTLGVPNAALQILQDLSKQFPKLSDPYREMAAIHIKQKNWRAAKTELEKLLILNPKDLKTRIGLIKVNLALKDIAAARSQAEVVKQNARQPRITFLISGDIEASAGNWKRAVSFYQKALSAGENPQIAIKLANAYYKSNQAKAAIDLLQKWHDKQSFSLISLILAEYYEKAGSTAQAIKVLEEVSAREPKNPVLWNNLAWLYLQANNEKYMQAATTAYKISPKSYKIADTYGWMLLQSENNKETALSILTQADDMSPGVPSIKYHLAVALHKNDRNAEAKMMLEQALSVKKPFAEQAQAEQLLGQL